MVVLGLGRRRELNQPARNQNRKTKVKTKIDTTQYEFSHGRKPRGRGRWAFNVNGAVLWIEGRLSEAKKAVRGEFPSAGKVEVLP